MNNDDGHGQRMQCKQREMDGAAREVPGEETRRPGAAEEITLPGIRTEEGPPPRSRVASPVSSAPALLLPSYTHDVRRAGRRHRPAEGEQNNS